MSLIKQLGHKFIFMKNIENSYRILYNDLHILKKTFTFLVIKNNYSNLFTGFY